MRYLRLLSLIILLVSSLSMAIAQDAPSDSVAVTVYNEGTALIRDQRTLDLQKGMNEINFTDVAETIDRTSVTFKSLTDPSGTFVLEQNYIYDLVNSEALLTRYLDEMVQITTEDGTVFTGQLLSGRSGEVILRNDNGEVSVISLSNVRDIRFPALPDGLITRPTLQWQLSSAQGGTQQVELTYMAFGMNWSADYNVLLAGDNASLDLNGWITLNNNSGRAFDDAKLKLIAGDVNRIQNAPIAVQRNEEYALMDTGSAPAPVEQRDLFEYKLYEVPRPVTIGNNQTKQIEFVNGTSIAASTYYVFDVSPNNGGYYNFIEDRNYGAFTQGNIQTHLEFNTGEESGLGADLPAGRMRVYQEDVDGAALLIGENTIDHTPEDEDVSIFLGNAFDIVGERTQSDFQAVTGRVIEETFEIHLRNRKDDKTVQVRIPEHLYRWSNWEITANSHDFTKLNSSTIEFRVDVAPGEEQIVNYTVRYVWPQ